jgi:sugar phosphate isomerase/epimerase
MARAVLVGCCAMSQAWLAAARETGTAIVGLFGKHPLVQMRTPGFGDRDWARVTGDLRLAGYRGSIDIEGWHDPVYRNMLELTGQKRAPDYLKELRGGAAYLPERSRAEPPPEAA